METKIKYHYDKESDILYISFFPGEKATTAVELNDNMLLRFNLEEKRAIGLTLMDFSVLIQLTNMGHRQFPLKGLENLEVEWREKVIEIITSPPVNKILKVSVYVSSMTENIPIAYIEKLPYSLAA
ncbi:MAG: DUF2283 domain-containing protein [Desulfobacterales bacterium]|nr:DUF2283 domain-containing protein [Desulfobacterales bacterium]